MVGRAAMGLVVVAWLVLALVPEARAWAIAMLMLPDLFNAVTPRPLALVSGAPSREELRIGRADIDLYRPSTGGRHGAVVLTLGVHPIDKREPVVVSLCEALGRAGLYVMIVQSEALVSDRIEQREPENLIAAFERLRGEPGVDPRRVGLAGFSAGASLAFLAAADARIANDVRLLSWFGGYADALELTGEIAAGSYVDGGARVPWQPHELSRYVFRKQLVDGLADQSDREALQKAYVDDFGRGDPVALANRGGLTPDGRAVATLFEATDPVALEQALATLPASAKERLKSTSPIGAVRHFRGRAVVMVDRADPLVPYVHSRDIAAALPSGRLARYVEFKIFEHVQPTKPLPPLTFARETWKLAQAVATILTLLDPAGYGP